MKSGTFRKNVLKTVQIKPIKAGLKQVARNTLRTHITHGIVSLNLHTGNVLQALTPYVLGEQMLPSMTDSAKIALGDVVADLALLCRALKVKMPTATKKSKLTGTRGAALMHMASLATDLLGFVHGGITNGPMLKAVEKEVVLPNKGGAKEMRTVEVIDVDAEKSAEALRVASEAQLVEAYVDVYWRLVFDMFKAPPQFLIDEKFAALQAENPDIAFDVDSEGEDDESASDEVAQPAATTSA